VSAPASTAEAEKGPAAREQMAGMGAPDPVWAGRQPACAGGNLIHAKQTRPRLGRNARSVREADAKMLRAGY
jgi:hypothetical protein